eukprot:474779-Amphidinium_carterae.1
MLPRLAWQCLRAWSSRLEHDLRLTVGVIPAYGRTVGLHERVGSEAGAVGSKFFGCHCDVMRTWILESGVETVIQHRR